LVTALCRPRDDWRVVPDREQLALLNIGVVDDDVASLIHDGERLVAVAHLAHAAAAGTNVGPLVMVYLLERELDTRRGAR